MKSIVHAWYAKHPALRLLLPFSYFYQFMFRLHQFLYFSGIKKIYHAPIPVIIVGNITVGGTGKTPLVIALAEYLTKIGYRPGVISRGYKGSYKKTMRVFPTSDVDLVGDEPLLIANKTIHPIVIARKRQMAIKKLLEETDCDLILSDDGLQHHALKKDIEILVIDGERGLGNKFCLPAGPLREPMSKLSTVDFVIETNSNSKQPSNYYPAFLMPGMIYNLINTDEHLNLSFIASKRIHAVAGIGHPERFFTMLNEMGLKFTGHAFSDHHHFTARDLSFCESDDVLIMTEKDAVKCKFIAKKNYWVLPIHIELSEPFKCDFKKKLLKLQAIPLARE